MFLFREECVINSIPPKIGKNKKNKIKIKKIQQISFSTQLFPRRSCWHCVLI